MVRVGGCLVLYAALILNTGQRRRAGKTEKPDFHVPGGDGSEGADAPAQRERLRWLLPGQLEEYVFDKDPMMCPSYVSAFLVACYSSGNL